MLKLVQLLRRYVQQGPKRKRAGAGEYGGTGAVRCRKRGGEVVELRTGCGAGRWMVQWSERQVLESKTAGDGACDVKRESRIGWMYGEGFLGRRGVEEKKVAQVKKARPSNLVARTRRLRFQELEIARLRARRGQWLQGEGEGGGPEKGALVTS